MQGVWKHRGREISGSDLESIRAVITGHPRASRRELSRLVCQALGWRQPNGELRDMVCRSLMLQLHRAGLILLPAVRFRPPNNVIAARKAAAAAIDTTPLQATLGEVTPLQIQQVRRCSEEKLVEALLEKHHYLGYHRPVGEHLKYLICSGGGRPIACMMWSSAPRHLGPRDRFIGWSAEARRRNIGFVAYNSRYLILPWVQVPHLGSHLLGRMARQLPADWHRIYGHSLYFLETFVDPGRFAGTCYRGANWVLLGLTRGLGKDSSSSRPNRPLKQVLGYPLGRRFRQRLCELS